MQGSAHTEVHHYATKWPNEEDIHSELEKFPDFVVCHALHLLNSLL
jgi:hypothetical protein